MRNMWLSLLCALVTITMVTGCENAMFTKANPRFRVWRDCFGGGVELSSNAKAQVQGVKFNPETGEFGVEVFALEHSPDVTRNADVNQITALVQQQLAVNAAIAQLFPGGIPATVQSLMPIFTKTGKQTGLTFNPTTGEIGFTKTGASSMYPPNYMTVSDEVAQRLANILTRLEKLEAPAATVTTTAPAETAVTETDTMKAVMEELKALREEGNQTRIVLENMSADTQRLSARIDTLESTPASQPQ